VTQDVQADTVSTLVLVLGPASLAALLGALIYYLTRGRRR